MRFYRQLEDPMEIRGLVTSYWYFSLVKY